MDDPERKRVLEALRRAFGSAKDVTTDGQPLHVLLPKLDVPDPWRPSPTRALTRWTDWPSGRPEFYVDEGLVNDKAQPPRGYNAAYLLGETWHGFSFNFPWVGDDPVRAVQLWLTRFLETT